MKIISCINRGSIIQMFVDDPSVMVINWDWGMFQHFVDSLLAENPNLTILRGLEIEYDAENGLGSVRKAEMEVL